MLNRLPYFNIAFAVLYFLFYLLNSWSYAIAGVLVTMIYSFLVLGIVEGKTKMVLPAYLTGILSVLFAVFLIVGSIHIFAAAVTQAYFANSWFYILFSFAFAVIIVWQFVLMCLKKNS